MTEIGQHAATDQFVPRKVVTVEELCADWLSSLHNARATTLNAYTYALAPLRERHGDLPVQKLTRPDLDQLLTDLRDGGSMTAKGHPRRAWSPRSPNKSVDAWRAMLVYGIERRELSRNVAAAMKKVPRVHREMQTYTPEEIRRVLRAADKDRAGHWTTASRCCWQGGTPASGWPSATSQSHWSHSPCGSPRYAEKLGASTNWPTYRNCWSPEYLASMEPPSRPR